MLALVLSETLPICAAPIDTQDPKDVKNLNVSTTTPPPGNGFYVGAYGGANFAQFYGTDSRGSSRDDWGGAGGLKLGYTFAPRPAWQNVQVQPAVEVEGLYLGTESNTRYHLGGPYTTTARNNFDSGAGMVNGILNFKTACCVTPYIGAGVGGEYLNEDSSHYTLFKNGTPIAKGDRSSDDFVFAPQAIVGVDIALTKHWSLFSEYKFIAAIDPRFNYNNVSGSGANEHFNPGFIGQNLAVAGLKYSF
jgi:opacity protein-like surface antigen